jgi:hypothetical protein
MRGREAARHAPLAEYDDGERRPSSALETAEVQGGVNSREEGVGCSQSPGAYGERR